MQGLQAVKLPRAAVYPVLLYVSLATAAAAAYRLLAWPGVVFDWLLFALVFLLHGLVFCAHKFSYCLINSKVFCIGAALPELPDSVSLRNASNHMSTR